MSSVLVGGLLVYLAAKAVMWAMDPEGVWALLTNADHAIYLRQAERVLAGGPLYNPWQLTGPYPLERLPELYPPPTVYGLIVPMSLVPDFLWWAIPIVVVSWVVWTSKPSRWAWVAILVCLAVPHTWTSIAAGNPAMWAAMAVALGTRYGWPGVFAVLKPTLAPFALVGVRTRGWWVAAGILAVASLVMLPAWLDYLVVVRNNTGGSLFYSLANAPLMVIPLAARR